MTMESGPPESDPRIVDPGHAPTPFIAEQIRLGSPEGRQVTIRNVNADGDVTHWTTTFTECDDVGTVIENQAIDGDGQPIGEVSRLKTTWDELQAHASFPADQTTITRDRIVTPIGELECFRYEVHEGEVARILWFAVDLPGLPVRTHEVEEGVARLSSEIVDSAP